MRADLPNQYPVLAESLAGGHRPMNLEYGRMTAIVSVITLAVLLLLFIRDRFASKGWGQLAKPLTLQEVFRDWIAYVLIFTTLSLMLRALLCLMCSHCESC